MSFTLKTFISLMAGVALSFTQAPYELWLLIFPCLGVFYFLYQSLGTKKQVFILSYLFALGYFIAGLYWIGNALLVEGNPYKWAWPLAVIALPALLSVFPALYVTINHILFKQNPLTNFIGFCLLLGFSEWVRGHAFTGFPWNLYGYGLASNEKLAQSLSLVGPYGLTFLTIFLGASIGYMASQKLYRPVILVVCAMIFGGIYSFGDNRLKNTQSDFHEDILFHIVQPNIAQSEKWVPENFIQNFETHINALELPLSQDENHVIIWPETAIPPSLINNPATHEIISKMLGRNASLLSGVLSIEQQQLQQQQQGLKYYNALMAWQGERPAQRIYAKSHLVPFGEYIPFQKYIPIPTVTNFSGFERGSGPQTIKLGDMPSFSPLICYEVIFPYKAISKKEIRPDYILTITNDAWYGLSAGPYQHFNKARFRAIEQGLPVVRSANTGISAVINPYGQAIKRLNLSQHGVVTSPLPKALLQITPYSQYGDKSYLLLSLFIFGLCLLKAKPHH